MDNNNTLKLISQKPLKQLILEQGEELKQVVNPKTGKSFFVCGTIRGYISPAAVKKLEDKDASVDDFKYALVQKGGESPVPCLLVVGNSNFKLVRTFEIAAALVPNPAFPAGDCEDDLPF